MISIPAGSLNKRIMLVKPSSEQDPLTTKVGEDVTVAQVWASIKPMSGSELYRAQQFVDQANIMVTIRYRPDVTADMRVEYGRRSFNVLSVLNEMEQNVQLNLLCEELL